MILVLVNGYGAPAHPEEDSQLNLYLRAVVVAMEVMEDCGKSPDRIFLAGGRTNRTDLSEACAMRRWFAANASKWVERLVLIDDTRDGQGNLRRFAQYVSEDDETMVFCSLERHAVMAALARRILKSRHVGTMGITLDRRRFGLVANLTRHAGVSFEVLALRFATVNALRVMLRNREIIRARRLSADYPSA